jgi:hypothetical protein
VSRSTLKLSRNILEAGGARLERRLKAEGGDYDDATSTPKLRQ